MILVLKFILNVLNLIIWNGYWYCLCDKIQGCENCYSKGKRYSYWCQIEDYYDNEDVEDVKYKPFELMIYVSEFYYDFLKKCQTWSYCSWRFE